MTGQGTWSIKMGIKTTRTAPSNSQIIIDAWDYSFSCLLKALMLSSCLQVYYCLLQFVPFRFIIYLFLFLNDVELHFCYLISFTDEIKYSWVEKIYLTVWSNLSLQRIIMCQRIYISEVSIGDLYLQFVADHLKPGEMTRKNSGRSVPNIFYCRRRSWVCVYYWCP